MAIPIAVHVVPTLLDGSNDRCETQIAPAAVERLFDTTLYELRLFPGAALAVYCRDRCVLTRFGGYADTQGGEFITPDSLFPLFSGSKPFASIALWQQIERGHTDLEEAVASHWPEFAQNGKGQVRIRHILSHRGGFPGTPTEMPRETWGDWDRAIQAIEAMPLRHEPGTVSAYHDLTQHWVCAELVQRLDGRTYPTYVYDDIAGPLALHDTFIGLPAIEEQRVVKLHATDGTDDRGRAVVRAMHDDPLYRKVVPGASAVSSARDMARFYAAIAAGGVLGGNRILRAETVAAMLRMEVDGEVDQTFGVPVRRCLGFELGGQDDPRRHWAGATSTARTFWHGGFGSSVCWGDADTGLAMAFLTNGVRRDEAGALARRDLSDAVRSLSS